MPRKPFSGIFSGSLSKLVAAAAITLAGSSLAASQSEIYRFNFSDGAHPQSALVGDKAGNLYGTTYYGSNVTCNGFVGLCGAVFQLSPPAQPGGAWTETVIHGFAGGSDGATPLAGLVIDKAGNLYGTTYYGGSSNCYLGCGVVYQLQPPATQGAAWTELVLYAFHGDDGSNPQSSLIFDSRGNLDGTFNQGTLSGYGFGGVFQLTPPAAQGGAWTESVLYNFTAGADGAYPTAGLILGKKGKLYGTTTFSSAGYMGSVFQLTPPDTPGGAWTEKTLHDFTYGGSDGIWPAAGLVIDKAGNLFGTTNDGGLYGIGSCAYGYWAGGCGTVFEISPTPDGAWTEKVLYSFTGGTDGANPLGGLVFDKAGNLFGTTQLAGNLNACNTVGCGTVFKLAPPTAGGGWTLTTIHDFAGGTDGAFPYATLLFDKGNLFGTTDSGGNNQICNGQGLGSSANGCGTIFKFTP